MQRVLLTGAAGFIGCQIARLLLNEGHEVHAIIRPQTDRWRLDGLERDLAIIDGDLHDLPAFRARLRAVRPDICLHLAWRGWAGQATVDDNMVSLSMSLNLLREMRDLSCDRFVAAGTCFEYDCRRDRLPETALLQPQGFNPMYGACKKALFELSQQFAALTAMRVVTPRVFNCYGPFEDAKGLIPSITLALLRGEPARVTPGQQVRDYLHVQDVASAIWRVATSDLTGAVNIASGEPVLIAEIAMRLGRMIGRPDLVHLGAIPYRPSDPMRIVADATLLRRHLGWAPKFDLDQGLADTVRWWRQQARVA